MTVHRSRRRSPRQIAAPSGMVGGYPKLVLPADHQAAASCRCQWCEDDRRDEADMLLDAYAFTDNGAGMDDPVCAAGIRDLSAARDVTTFSAELAAATRQSVQDALSASGTTPECAGTRGERRARQRPVQDAQSGVGMMAAD